MARNGGHPWYCSAEQARGAARVGPGTDVWSWGAALCYLVQGGSATVPPPCGAGERAAEGLAAVGTTAAGGGGGLAALLRQCFAPDPGARPTAAQCAQQLELLFARECADGRPYFRQTAPPATAPEGDMLSARAQALAEEPSQARDAIELYRRALRRGSPATATAAAVEPGSCAR